MEEFDRPRLKRAILTLPWTLLRMVGRTIKGFLIVLGAMVVVGALGDDFGANREQGSAYVFVRSGTTWTGQIYGLPNMETG